MKILASTVFSSTLMAMSVAASTSGGASNRTPARNTLQCSAVECMVRCVVRGGYNLLVFINDQCLGVWAIAIHQLTVVTLFSATDRS